MFRGPLAPPCDSTIITTCARQLPNDSLGLAGDLVALACDLVGEPSDSQISLCDLLALPIVSLATSKEVARCEGRIAHCTEGHARSANANAPCSEKVARSSDWLPRCNGRVVRSTERLVRYSERLSPRTERLAGILSAYRSL